MNKIRIMGVINTTPDSFSDGGEFYTPERAINHAMQLLTEGADIIDIGGESTRPGAQTISPEEETARVVPVIAALKNDAPTVSIDTRNAATMSAAINAGANFINDVSALRHDPQAVHVAAQSNLPICLMHMHGTPQDMQNRPHYDDVMSELCSFFEERLNFCTKNGIKQENIILDPGIGFGKTLAHNLTIIKNLSHFKRFGCPILLGVSRKSVIGKISGEEDPKNRLPGSLAAALYGIGQGADILRVHDVAATLQAVRVLTAIDNA